ncbi:ABC transporter ATP-binding protein [Chitinimonas sp.]|uniref:ABC transporter ATP-binding protein n=1 Tax=Chitinimonas sp. TaxID=1934313 RepID=UPI0035B08FA2
MSTNIPYTRQEVLLSMQDVDLDLGGKPILRKLNLQVRNIVRPGMQQGQVIGLLGPSGLGKTQLFRLLAGLQAPSRGQIRLGGEQRPVSRGMVGMVGQQYLLFDHYTVLGNLMLAARQQEASAEQAMARVSELLERFGLAQQAHAYPGQLSGGQRQRVAIAQQLLCSSHFLLLDEPFSGLDPLMADRVGEFINQLATSHELNTIMLITHDVGLAVRLCDTLWLMGREHDENGSIVPGATLRQEIDLIERGLCWQPDLTRMPAYHDCVDEVRAAFATL